MADANQKNELPVRPALTRAYARACMRKACWLVVLLTCGLAIPSAKAADSYSTVVSKHLALETGTAVDKESEAENPQTADLKRAVMAEAKMLPQGPRIAPPPPNSQSAVVMAVVLPLAGLLALGTVGYLVKRRLDSMASARALTEGRSESLLVEDPSVAFFFRELRDALIAPAAAGGADARANDVQSQTSEEAAHAAPDPLQEFFASVPSQIASLRRSFSEISRASDDAARHQVLLEFLQQVSGLKDSARMTELRPVWLVASALEGLLQQLSKDATDVTTSVLGTAAAAVDLLEVLAIRGLNPDLATEPPVKLLAVDDDPVSRLAISFALKKAFNPPDLAPDGETALGLVARETYDVIFLDVDMPGMDGYELCTKIHQTDHHRTTPVVFVTRHSDFQSRAKSTLSGGEDLIGKPFLAFEITVKALTLALRGRLQNNKATCPTSQKARPAIAATASELAAIVSPATTQPPETPSISTAEQPGLENQSGTTTLGSTVSGNSSWEVSNRGFQALYQASRDDSADAFFNHAPAYLEQLRHELQAAQHATEPAKLQDFLDRLCAGVHSLASEAERTELRTVSRLSSALEGMLKKMSEHTKLCTPSTFTAAAAALELLEELCSRTEANPDLENPPVRILVVDDDPVARRAIAMSIQLVFGRPDNAESGEAAVALAAEKSFDLIFLDVLMPGIDGFATCKKVHKTALNQRTPVVFITSHDDVEARSQAVVSGGCGFIPKPALSSQITLTALTFILRSRLKQQSAPTPALEEAACLQTA